MRMIYKQAARSQIACHLTLLGKTGTPGAIGVRRSLAILRPWTATSQHWADRARQVGIVRISAPKARFGLARHQLKTVGKLMCWKVLYWRNMGEGACRKAICEVGCCVSSEGSRGGFPPESAVGVCHMPRPRQGAPLAKRIAP